MGRTISISTELFAAIWVQRKPGEETESEILERILNVPKIKGLINQPLMATEIVGSKAGVGIINRPQGAMTASGPLPGGGIINRQFSVHFPEGFEIFRRYKDVDYVAAVRGGRWLMNGQSYPSLHKLSMAVAEGNENSWVNWKYRDAGGNERMIDNLRQRPNN